MEKIAFDEKTHYDAWLVYHEKYYVVGRGVREWTQTVGAHYDAAAQRTFAPDLGNPLQMTDEQIGDEIRGPLAHVTAKEMGRRARQLFSRQDKTAEIHDAIAKLYDSSQDVRFSLEVIADLLGAKIVPGTPAVKSVPTRVVAKAAADGR